MDNLGRLIPRAKIRGKKRVMKEIVMRMEEHAQGGHDYSGKCYISNSACYDDARAVADEIDQNQIFRICFSKILSQSCILAGCSGKEYRLSVFEVLFYLTVGKSHTALNVF